MFPERISYAFDHSLMGDTEFKRKAGNRKFTYRYNAKSVDAAWRDAQAFLDRHMGAKR